MTIKWVAQVFHPRLLCSPAMLFLVSKEYEKRAFVVSSNSLTFIQGLVKVCHVFQSYAYTNNDNMMF
jgi:hypothetical protein